MARGRGADIGQLTSATAHLDPPLAALDRAVLAHNTERLVGRAGGTPVRIASKSVRCRSVLELALATPGVAGVMAYSLAEAVWLARNGVRDVLVGYPTVDKSALADLLADDALLAAVTVMVDDQAQVDVIRSVGAEAPVRVCLDVDASLRLGPVHLGVRRSPLRTPTDAATLAAGAAGRGCRVVGVMFYEAQVAGMPDTNPVVRAVKRRTVAELGTRRREVVAAVTREVGPLEFVNSGGTGSLESSAADPTVTEVTAGSGLYMPALFDGYRSFASEPALFFALPVVRRPARGIVTAFGGGYPASGPAGRSRLPRPAAAGMRLLRAEGTGEVQTPLTGPGAATLKVGDRVWFRHAKAGELAERFAVIHVVEDGRLVESVPTYRGEGMAFG